MTAAIEKKETEKDLNVMKSFAKNQEKYELLFERDNKMTQFIDNYEKTVESLLAKKTAVETEITQLLQHMSVYELQKQDVDISTEPNGTGEGELACKEKQKEESGLTLKHVQNELAKSEAELQKLKSLDTKIPAEMQKWEELTNWNSKVRKLKSSSKKMTSTNNKETLQKQLAQQKQELDETFNQLNSNSYYQNNLKELITKQENLKTEIELMEKNLSQEKKNSEFESLLQDTILLTQKVNSLMIKQISLET
ncbi:hypothetical protein RFI_22941 [Reticulomyxa filosa]|uniref:Uncharacterized protein n=1 Tax=Reticulomyxa filosa TaxID=46433 RepID=X6MLX9_RETFI|nr:hypothetical protein RFI_22941 [Reticulomyxa filosa]|eukprot:ETO14427.1 hypothetical protein RFI_22941 [Reticulomyxa filosa]